MDSVIFRGTMGYPIFRPTYIVNVIKSPPETDQFWVPFGASIPHVKPTWENPTGSTAETEVRAIQRSDLCGGRGGLMGVGRCWKWGHCFQILNLFCSCPLNIHFFRGDCRIIRLKAADRPARNGSLGTNSDCYMCDFQEALRIPNHQLKPLDNQSHI